jgi:hypothetical protein
MRAIIFESARVYVAVIESHNTEAFHFSSFEFTFIFDPVATLSVQDTTSLEHVVSPFPIVLNTLVGIVQCTIAEHLVFVPVSVIEAAIRIGIFTFSMTLFLYIFLSFICIAACIDFVNLVQIECVNWPVLGCNSGLDLSWVNWDH